MKVLLAQDRFTARVAAGWVVASGVSRAWLTGGAGALGDMFMLSAATWYRREVSVPGCVSIAHILWHANCAAHSCLLDALRGGDACRFTR